MIPRIKFFLALTVSLLTLADGYAAGQLAITSIGAANNTVAPGDVVPFVVGVTNISPTKPNGDAVLDFGGGLLDISIFLTSTTLPTIDLGTDTVTIPFPGIASGGGRISLSTNRTIPLSYSAAGNYTLHAKIDFAPITRATAAATLSASLTAVNLTAHGSGYTSAPVVNITGGGGTGATALAVLGGGAVVAVHITNPGSGYISEPSISFVGGGGSGAAATAVITGRVSAVDFLQSGTGYASAPTITLIDGGGGLGAAATIVPSGVVSSFTITSGGAGFTGTPTVTLSGGGGAGATATATISTGVTAVNVTDPGSNYTSSPTVSFTGGGGGSGAAAVAVLNGGVTTVAVNFSGQSYTSGTLVSFFGGGGVGATGTATVDGSGHVTSITVTSPGTGYASPPAVVITNGTGVGAAATASIAGPIGSVVVTSSGSNYSSPPAVVFANDGGGSGATATTAISGVLSSIAVASGGVGYTSGPDVAITGGGGSGANATSRLTFDGGVATVTAGGSDYTSPPTVILVGGGDGGIQNNGVNEIPISGATFATSTASFVLNPKPDLEITGLTYPAGVAYTGGEVIPMSLTFINRTRTNGLANGPVVFVGGANVPAGSTNPLRIQVVLSSNPVYGDADDFQLTTHDITTRVNADGITHTLSWNQLLPGNFAGSYYVLAKIDSLNALDEAVENDTAFAGNNIWIDTNATRIALLPTTFPTTALTSTDAAITRSANGYSDNPSISADGRYTVFASDAANIVAGDTNGKRDIFIFDNQNKTTRRLSLSQQGAQTNGASNNPSISADGRYVAFASDATNLILGDTNGFTDIFVVDAITGAISRESVSSTAAQSNNSSFRPALSQDGRYLVFESSATNLNPAATGGTTQIFLRDRTLGTTGLISCSTGGAAGNGGSLQAAVSGDGRYVAFASDATNLVANDSNGYRDIFLRDTVSGTTIRASVGPGGVQSVGASTGGASRSPTISADGRYTAFASDAINLVMGDTNNVSDVFVYDRVSASTTRVSVASSGDEGADPSGAPFNIGSFNPNISSSGRYVTFASLDNNLASGDTVGQFGTLAAATVAGGAVTDLAVTNPGGGVPLANGVTAAYYTTTPNVTISGGGGTGATAAAILSGPGTTGYITGFTITSGGTGYTSAPNVVIAGSFNAALNIYVLDRDVDGSGTFDTAGNISSSLVSVNQFGYQTVRVLGVQSSAASDIYPVISSDGRWVALPSDAELNVGLGTTTTNLLSNDSNGARDIFLHDRRISSVSNPDPRPVVTITSPGTGNSVLVNTAIPVTASATTTVGVVSSVQFFVNGTSLGTSSVFPYTQTWTPTAVGTFTLSALVTDSFGNQGVSSNVVVTVNAAPSIGITSPVAGATFTLGASPVITAAAAATTPGATIASVQFYVNGAALGAADVNAPYSVVWSPSGAGGYSLTAVATDSIGTKSTSPAVSVSVIAGPTVPPSVALALPADGATVLVSTPQTITATASSSVGTVTKVEFFANGTSLGAVTSFPYALDWTPVTPGIYTLTAVGTDNNGVSSTSLAHTISVSSGTPGGGTGLISPAAGTSVPVGSSVILKAEANPVTGVIKQIQFFDNGTAIGSPETTAPYALAYTPQGAPGTVHSITAQAMDNDGALLTLSAPVAVNVVAAITPLPTSVISTPTHNAGIALPDYVANSSASIPIVIDAHSSNGRITKVELYIDGELFGSKETFPYAFTWRPQVAGTYEIIALTYDDKNNVVASTTSVPTATAAVTGSRLTNVSIASAGSGYTSSAVVTFTGGGGSGATATTTMSVTRLAITNPGTGYTTVPTVVFSGGGGIGAAATASVSGGFVTGVTITSAGSGFTSAPTIAFVGGGGSGATATATLGVSGITLTNLGTGYTSAPAVSFSSGTNASTPAPTVVTIAEPPTVTITLPLNNDTVTGNAPAQIRANVTSGNGSPILSVQFFDTGTFIGTANPPSSGSLYTLTFTPIQHFNSDGDLIPSVLTALATDGLGISKVSTGIVLNVTAGGSPPPPPVIGVPPSVTLTSPVAGSQLAVNAPITLTASALDPDGNIISVQFFQQKNGLGAPDTVYPYGTTWTPTNPGTYTFTAKATDNDANSVESLPVTITVVDPSLNAPSVSIASPVTGSALLVGSPVTVVANATDDVAVASVQFFVNGQPQGGLDTIFPFTLSWTPTSPGTYVLAAQANDNVGNQRTSQPVIVTVSSGTQPSVAITYPSNHSSVPVNKSTTIRTLAFLGTNPISSVTYSISGNPDTVINQYPYDLVWTPANVGDYTISATVTDTVGNTASSTPIIVTAAAGVTVLTSSATSAFIPQGSSIVLNADVNLGQGAVKQMEFFDNGGSIGVDTAAPYSVVFTPTGNPGTTHVLTAQPTDNVGAALTASVPLMVTVSVAVAPLPTVTINTPRDQAKIAIPTDGNAIPISIDARSANGFISKLEFYIDGQLFGTKTAFPYSFNWTPTFAGTYRLVALAYDDKNNSVASGINTVSVSAPPSVSITSPANNATITGGAITQVTVTATSANGYPVNVQLFADDKYVGETSVAAAGAPSTILYTAIQKTIVDRSGNVTVVPTPLYVIASDPLGFATTSTPVSVNVTNGGSSTGSTVIGLRPVVTVTDPLGGTNFPVSAPVKLSANASDPDGNIVQVIFSANGQIVSTLTAYPYNATWTPTNLGTYAITAKVTDNDGNTITSSPVTVTVTDSGPNGTSVAITAPTASTVFTAGSETTLRATATDDVSIANVQYFINGQPFGEKLTSAPYNLKWTPATAGTYTIFARATDNVGNQATSAAVTVTVNPNAAPTVALTSPAAATTIASGASVALAATASDSDGHVTSVKFLANNIVIGSAPSENAPYTFTWTPSGAGTYTLAAQATDDSGNITTSSTLGLTVLSNQPPAVAITAPRTGNSVNTGDAVTITATASDADGSVANVQFYANGVLVQSTASQPYQVTWKPVAAGVYRLTAVATDNAGATTTSATVTVVAAPTGSDATDTVITGPYINFNTSAGGTFSLIDLHGQSVTFIGYVPAADTTTAAKTYYFANVPLDSSGNFQLTNDANAVIFSGLISATGASGSFTDGANSVMFGGTNTVQKPNVAPAGFYTGSVTDHSGSFLTGFVGMDGILTLYMKDGTFTDAGAGSVNATSGNFSITTRSGNKITGTADPLSGLLTGTLTKSGATTSDTFTGAQASGTTISDGSLRNISSRGFVGTGNNLLIAGFVVNGATPKQVLVRAVGPTLAGAGVQGALANPLLRLFDRTGTPIGINDDWSAALAPTASDVGAQPLTVGSLDSAILTTLAPGLYTAQVTGVGNTTGIALVELYDVDAVAAFSSEKMVNISTRGFVGTGDNILIAGFVVNGTSPKKVLVRGVGPSLTTVGISTGYLADPVLRIARLNAQLVRENDNWSVGNDAGLVAAASSKVGAFPLTAGSKDAVILMNLPPGIYTALLSGAGSSTGIGMIEVYEVQ